MRPGEGDRAREPGQSEQGAIPEPVSRFEPIERRVNVAKSRVDNRARDRWSLTLGAKLPECAATISTAARVAPT